MRMGNYFKNGSTLILYEGEQIIPDGQQGKVKYKSSADGKWKQQCLHFCMMLTVTFMHVKVNIHESRILRSQYCIGCLIIHTVF